MKYFITGTDTGVGKTLATIILTKYLRKSGKKVGVVKPVESGIDSNNFPDYKLLAKAAKDIEKKLFLLSQPLAPYIAAKLDRVNIDISKIIDFINNDSNNYDIYLIEGAGGLFVPITENFMMIDLITHLKCEVILVARTNLGTVNHTLLSIEALKSRNIRIKEIILNEVIKTKNSEIIDNKNMIENFSNIKIKNIIRHLSFDIEHILEKFYMDLKWS